MCSTTSGLIVLVELHYTCREDECRKEISDDKCKQGCRYILQRGASGTAWVALLCHRHPSSRGVRGHAPPDNFGKFGAQRCHLRVTELTLPEDAYRIAGNFRGY